MEQVSKGKAWYKKWWVWVGVAIVVVIGMASNRGSKTGATEPSTDLYPSDRIIAMKVPENYTKATSLLRQINLELLSKGDGIKFGGSFAGEDNANVYFLSNDTVRLKYTHKWAKNGDAKLMRAETEEGMYLVMRRANSDVTCDNEYWPLYDSVIVLLNDSYGYDNGFKNLPKGFLIAKSRKGEESTQLRLYKWLDPINYPSRNQEYTFTASLEISEITK